MFALNSCLLAQIDFNLYGMGQLRLGNALFRHPLPEGPHLRQGWADSPNLHLSEGTPCMPCQSAYINGCAPVLQILSRLWQRQGLEVTMRPYTPKSRSFSPCRQPVPCPIPPSSIGQVVLHAS